MRKISINLKLVFLFSLVFFLRVLAVGQIPESFRYQAVVRNNSGEIISNSTISVRISIVKGNEIGDIVYRETHSTTTNHFGLINLNIGQGNSSDDFASIDWGNDYYFTQIELDLEGGANYSLLGVSKLLSVPYAIHSKTVEAVDYSSITNTPIIPEDIMDLTDSTSVLFSGSFNDLNDKPIGTSTGDMQYWDGSNWVNVPAGQNNQILTFCDGIPTWTNNGQCQPKVGDFTEGGVVFYIFQEGDPGYIEGETHGLVCTVNDQSTDAVWGCFGTEISGADGTGIGTGEQNTIDIDNDCVTTGIAADICTNLNLNGYDDWFLPSKEELNQIYLNKATINATAQANGGSDIAGTRSDYWSSSENSSDGAWLQTLTSGTPWLYGKTNSAAVRAIRSF